MPGHELFYFQRSIMNFQQLVRNSLWIQSPEFGAKGKDKVQPRTGHEGPEGEQRYSYTLSLTSALDGVSGQRHAPAALPPGKRPGTHCIGGWVGPRSGLDGCGKSRPHRDSIPGSSSPQRVAIPSTPSRPTLRCRNLNRDKKMLFCYNPTPNVKKIIKHGHVRPRSFS